MSDTNNPVDFNDFPDLGDLKKVDSIDDLSHLKNDVDELDARNLTYSILLDDYENYISESLESKQIYKKWITITLIFILIIIILGLGYMSYIIMSNPTDKNIPNYISLGTIFISFISSIIIIPTHIIKYTFNQNETQQIGEIIKNIQNYDTAVREDIYKVKYELVKKKMYEQVKNKDKNISE